MMLVVDRRRRSVSPPRWREPLRDDAALRPAADGSSTTIVAAVLVHGRGLRSRRLSAGAARVTSRSDGRAALRVITRITADRTRDTECRRDAHRGSRSTGRASNGADLGVSTGRASRDLSSRDADLAHGTRITRITNGTRITRITNGTRITSGSRITRISQTGRGSHGSQTGARITWITAAVRDSTGMAIHADLHGLRISGSQAGRGSHGSQTGADHKRVADHADLTNGTRITRISQTGRGSHGSQTGRGSGSQRDADSHGSHKRDADHTDQQARMHPGSKRDADSRGSDGGSI